MLYVKTGEFDGVTFLGINWLGNEGSRGQCMIDRRKAAAGGRLTDRLVYDTSEFPAAILSIFYLRYCINFDYVIAVMKIMNDKEIKTIICNVITGSAYQRKE